MTFIADMAKALAWPAAAIVIVVLFREQMAALLGRVTNVTTPLGSINAEAREARQEAENLPPVPDSDDQSIEELGDAEAAEDDLTLRRTFERGLQNAKRLAMVSPKDGVNGAWQVFLDSARTMTQTTDDGFEWVASRSALANLGMWGLDPEALEVVKALAHVHGATDEWVSAPVSQQAAVDFCEAAERVLYLIWSIARHPSRSAVTRARLEAQTSVKDLQGSLEVH